MHTKAFDHFHPEWERFIGARNLVGGKFESDAQLLTAAVNVMREFVDEANAYTSALSENERKCIRDLLFSASRLFCLPVGPGMTSTVCSAASKKLSTLVSESRMRDAPFYTAITGPIEKMCGAEPKISPQDLETVVREMGFPEKIMDEDFISALGGFMSEVDAFASENARVEVKIPPPKPFDKGTLSVLQEVLGVLHNCGDDAGLRERSRVERFLKSSGVTILWPEEDVVEETEEFFVVFMPGEKAARTVKPCLKFENLVFRGEKIMPA